MVIVKVIPFIQREGLVDIYIYTLLGLFVVGPHISRVTVKAL